jgi:hypothetical protein
MMDAWVCIRAREDFPKLEAELNRLSKEGYEILTVLDEGKDNCGWRMYNIIAHRPDWKEEKIGGTD